MSIADFRRVWPLAVSYGLLLASLYVLKPARNALFLDQLGVGRLPWVLLVVASAGALVAGGFSRVGTGARLASIVGRLLLSGGLVILLFRFALNEPSDAVVFAFYLGVNLFGQLATSLLWLWATASFDTREAQRVFGFIAGLGILGALLGGVASHAFARLVGTLNLLWLAAALVVTAGLWLIATPSPTLETQTAAVPRASLLRVVGSTRLVRLLALAGTLSAAVSALVELQFNGVVDAAFVARDDKTAFFGGFFAWLNAGTFAFQMLLGPLLLRRLGVGIALLVLPLTLAFGALGILLVPGVTVAVAQKAADVGLRHSLHRSVVELLFAPVPAAVRRRARLLVDATFDNLGTALGAGLGLVLLTRLDHGTQGMALGTLVCLVGWLVVGFRLRPAYLLALRAGFERREVHPDELRVDSTGGPDRELLVAGLASDRPRQVEYALELLSRGGVTGLTPLLQPLLGHGAPSIRRRALTSLWQQDRALGRAAASALRSDLDSGVRLAAAQLLLQADFETHEAKRQEMHRLLHGSDPLLWQAALLSVTAADRSWAERLLQGSVLERLRRARGPDAALARASLVAALARLGRPTQELLALAEGGEVEVKRAFVEVLATRADEAPVAWLVSELGDRALRTTILRILPALAEVVRPELARALLAGPERLRGPLSRAFVVLGGERSLRTLTDVAMALPAEQRTPLLEASVELRRRGERPLGKSYVDALLAREVDWLGELSSAHDALVAERAAGLLLRALRERSSESRERLFRCLALYYSVGEMDAARLGARGRAPRGRARALSLLAEALEPAHRRLLLPLLEQSERAPTAPAAPSRAVDAWLLGLADDWLVACALFCRAEHLGALVTEVDHRLASPVLVVRQAAQLARRRSGGPSAGTTETNYTGAVLTVVEKVLLLERVDVFAEASSEQLSLIAAIATERELRSGEALYREQDPADSMYVVVRGAVRLHRSEGEVMVVGPGQTFGTWALFEEEPRLTSATSSEPSLVLRIERADFLDVLADHVEVTRAVLSAVAKRLRALLASG